MNGQADGCMDGQLDMVKNYYPVFLPKHVGITIRRQYGCRFTT